MLEVRGNAFGVGGVVGVMIEPTPTTRVGIQYTAPMPLEYNDIIDEVKGAGPSLQFFRLLVGAVADIPVGSQVDLKLSMPQQVMASAYHAYNDRLALMLNFGWQNWSAFGRPSLLIKATPNQRPSRLGHARGSGQLMGPHRLGLGRHGAVQLRFQQAQVATPPVPPAAPKSEPDPHRQRLLRAAPSEPRLAGERYIGVAHRPMLDRRPQAA
jgi:hypothetical protein